MWLRLQARASECVHRSTYNPITWYNLLWLLICVSILLDRVIRRSNVFNTQDRARIYIYRGMCDLLGGGVGGVWDVLGFWGLGGRGACSKCTLRRQEGMISQRCSSPQHLAMMPRCWSSRGIQVCCTSSSQVMLVSYLSKSNKDMYCIEILYKYDHTFIIWIMVTLECLRRVTNYYAAVIHTCKLKCYEYWITITHGHHLII